MTPSARFSSLIVMAAPFCPVRSWVCGSPLSSVAQGSQKGRGASMRSSVESTVPKWSRDVVHCA